jgi:hypothetical protein
LQQEWRGFDFCGAISYDRQKRRNLPNLRDNSMKKIFVFPLAFVLTIPALVFISPAIALSQERLGTSCADCPNYSGAFSIENQTGVTIRYQVKWGASHAWREISLASGHIETHSYPLGDNRNAQVPTPYVRFDRIGGDGRFTPQEYRMQFYAIGYAGFGPRTNSTQPKRYFFNYGPDGKSLDLSAR